MKRVIVVTGANDGIGRAMAIELAARGHSLRLVCRNRDKGEAVCKDICAQRGDARLFVADLSVREDVERVAIELAGEPIDTLVHNAGVHLHERSSGRDGIETMFMVNYLAPFILTGRLIQRLRSREAPRVVSVSSMGHKFAKVDWDDLQCERAFSAFNQYCATKLYNVWFTRELHRRYGQWFAASCFHPGAVATGFAQDDSGWLHVMMKLGKLFLRTPEKGARSGVLLAADPAADRPAGQYFVDIKPRRPSKTAMDADAAARLWRLSEEMTGVVYPAAS